MRSKIRICTDLNNLVNRVSLNKMTLKQFSNIPDFEHLKDEAQSDQQKIQQLIEEHIETYGEEPRKSSCGKMYIW
ncbi:MAG: hypothetical protein FWE44_00955 [Defluviitaleaceae bacterium]|nr:hypothetical protein [Defluviitaleaceae bacterium]